MKLTSFPIGIFDSGVGGTSIWKELHSLLPFENTIYLADSKHAPYGTKGKDRIIELCIKNTEYLLSQNCKLIIVACNTATTNAIKVLREHYNVPFIGIEPAIKPAALNTKTKAIGILATMGTLSSHLFHTTSDLYSGNIKVIEQDGEDVEDGATVELAPGVTAVDVVVEATDPDATVEIAGDQDLKVRYMNVVHRSHDSLTLAIHRGGQKLSAP